MRKIENQFNDYLLHQLNVDRMTLRERTNGEVDNKPVFGKNEKRDHDIAAEESKKIIAAYEKKYSSFKADAEKVWSYSKNLLNMRVKAGERSANINTSEKKSCSCFYVFSHRRRC